VTASSTVSRSDVERFWSKTKVDGQCVVWTAGKDKDGYGKFATGGHRKQTHFRAHRWIYQRACGDITGKILLHLCHNPACVALHHLTPGSQKENIAQAIARGLHASVTRWL
jgi:HNH endonuclease